MRRLAYILLMLVLVMTTIGCINNTPQGQANQIAGKGLKEGTNNNVDNPDGNALESNMGDLSLKTLESGKVTMLLPDGWITQILPGCAGLVAVDSSNMARSVIFMNGLHQIIAPLPPGLTPEGYVETYIQKDFKTMSNVKLLKYEDTDLSNLRTGGADVKAMRISFDNNGVSAIGSVTVNTYGMVVSSAIGYIWGVSSTANEFDADKTTLLKMMDSIKYDEATLQGCRDVLKGSWSIK